MANGNINLEDVIVDTNVEINDEGKTNPVQETEVADAPVQENQASEPPTLASSGDLSSILEEADEVPIATSGTVEETHDVDEGIKVSFVDDKEFDKKVDDVIVKMDKEITEDSIINTLNNDEEFKREQEVFSALTRQDIERYARDLLIENPNMTEEDFNAKIEARQNQLWREQIQRPRIQEIYKRVVDGIRAPYMDELKQIDEERTKNLQNKGLWNMNVLQSVGYSLGARPKSQEGAWYADGLFTLGTAIDDYISGTFNEYLTRRDLSQAHHLMDKVAIYDTALQSGEITQEEYNSMTADLKSQLEDVQEEYFKGMADDEENSRINQVLKQTITDTDDPEFHTLKNYILTNVDQLPNMIPSLAAKNPIGLAAAIMFYGNQLQGEYINEAARAYIANRDGISEDEVTPEMIANALLYDDEGRNIITDTGQAGGIFAIPELVVNRLILTGGKIGKAVKSPKVANLLKNQFGKLLQNRLVNNWLTRSTLTGAGEVVEELTQNAAGTFVAEKYRNPNANFFEKANTALSKTFDWDNKESRDTAIISFISGGGTTLTSNAIQGGYRTTKGVLQAKQITDLANLLPEKFNSKIEYEKAGLQEILNSETASQQEKLQATQAYYSVLDTEQAYNELKDHPNIQGSAKGVAMTLLQERADLRRQIDLAANNGLVANQKERVKAIDERLARIESRAKKGYKSSTLEKIRGLFGKRSVGAMRAANAPQKAIDAIENLAVGVSDFSELYRRIQNDPSLANIANIDGIAQEVYETIESDEYQKADQGTAYEYLRDQEKRIQREDEGELPIAKETKPVDNLPDVVDIDSDEVLTPEQRTKIEEFYHSQGLPVDERFTKRFDTPYIMPENVGRIMAGIESTDDIDTAVGKLIKFNENRGELARLAAYEASRSENISNRSNVAQGIRNKSWVPNRIKKGVAAAESALKRSSKLAKKYKGRAVDALKEFVDTKYALDALVHDYINKHLENSKVIGKRDKTRQSIGLWDRTIDDINEITDALSRGGIDKETKTAYQKELSHRLQQLTTYYSLGLEAIERKIAEQGAITGEYPPYFNAERGRFEFKFQPQYGNSIAYEQFPENGEAIFNSMTPQQWSSYVTYLAKYEDTGTDASLGNLKREALKIYAKNKNLKESDVIADDKKEQEAIERAHKILDAGDIVRTTGAVANVGGRDIIIEDAEKQEAKESTRSVEGIEDDIQQLKGDTTKYKTRENNPNRLKEVHKNRAILRWENFAKADKKSGLEGDMLHMIFVTGAAQKLTDRQSDFLNAEDINDLFDVPHSIAWQNERIQEIDAELAEIESVQGWSYIDELYNRHHELQDEYEALELAESESTVTIEESLGGKFEKTLKEYIELVGVDEAISFLNRARNIEWTKNDLLSKAQAGNEIALRAIINQHETLISSITKEFAPDYKPIGNTAGGVVRGVEGKKDVTPEVDSSAYTDWDTVFSGSTSATQLTGVARQALRKAILYYDPSYGSQGAYFAKVIRGAIVSSMNGEGINWAPVNKTIQYREAINKIELMKSLWLGDVFGTNLDRNLIGESDKGSAVLSEEQAKFAHNLIKNEKDLHTTVIKQTISQTQSLIEVTSDAAEIARLDGKIKLLRERLEAVNNDTDVSALLIPSTRDNASRNSGYMPGSNEYNLVLAAGTLAKGGDIDNQVLSLIDSGEVTDVSLNDYQKQLQVYQASTTVINQTQEKLDMASNEAKSISLSRDINEGINETQRQALEKVKEKKKNLKGLLKAQKEAQLKSSQVIVAVGSGRVKVEGLSQAEVKALKPADTDTSITRSGGNEVFVVKDGVIVPTTEVKKLEVLAEQITTTQTLPAKVNTIINDNEALIADVDNKLEKIRIDERNNLEQIDKEINSTQYNDIGMWDQHDENFTENPEVYNMDDFVTYDYHGEMSEQELAYEGIDLGVDSEGDRGVDTKFYGATQESKDRAEQIFNTKNMVDDLRREIDIANNAIIALQGLESLDTSGDIQAKKLYLDSYKRIEEKLNNLMEIADDGEINLIASKIKSNLRSFDIETLQNNLPAANDGLLEAYIDRMEIESLAEREKEQERLEGKKPPTLLFMTKRGFTKQEMLASSNKFEALDREVDTRSEKKKETEALIKRNMKDAYDRDRVAWKTNPDKIYTLDTKNYLGYYTVSGAPKGLQTFLEYEQNFDQYIGQGYTYEEMALLFIDHMAKRPEASPQTLEYLPTHFDNVMKIFADRGKLDEFNKALGPHSDVLYDLVQESKGPIPIFRGEHDLFNTNKPLVHGSLSLTIAKHHASRERKDSSGKVKPNPNPTIKVFYVNPSDIKFVMNTRTIDGVGEMEVFLKGENLPDPQILSVNELNTLDSKRMDNDNKEENCR